VRIESIVFDCSDAAPLARFWADALGWSVAPYDEEELERLASKGIYDPEDDPSVMVEPPTGELPLLFFTEVPEDKATKNRVHLDLAADGPLEEEVQRLEGLGAHVRNWAEEDGSTWCVMLDPQGNEFCVVPAPDGDDGDDDDA
jgi:catechol 2,3-dioxygenase-like lactoylglutathione lyase family enzyme